VITGANAGLGLRTAATLLKHDDAWHVVLAVRDVDRGRAAAATLGAPERTTVAQLDLASLGSVNRFVAALPTLNTPPLHALICNAGIQYVQGVEYTEDGIELTFGVNHLGHFALTQGLLPHLTPPARIVVVSSDTHDPRRSTGMPTASYTSAEQLAHPPTTDATPARQRYTTSKLCNILFTYELDRRLRQNGSQITVNAFNPGLMPGSGLARNYNALQRFAWRFVLPALRILPQVRSTKQSGRYLAALASDRRYDGVSGKYFDGLTEIESSSDSYDTAKATDLWKTSEELIVRIGSPA
jgi:NAD(P)-dependent dehydrogenase (short-subunit alcohol dehydrogenase family)